MIRCTRSLDINRSSQAVWASLGRFMHIDEFAPEIVSVDALTEAPDDLGARRRCNFKNGKSLVEEVSSWQPGRGYSVELSDMEWLPFHKAGADLSIVQLGADRSRVIWTVRYHVKFGFLGWLMGQTVMKLNFGKVVEAALNGLSEHVMQRAAPESSLAG